MKTKELIRILRTFNPESEPIGVFTPDAEFANHPNMEVIGWVSDNNGSPQLNLESFCEQLAKSNV